MSFTKSNELGVISISADVLGRIAGKAATDCYGVVGMAARRATDGLIELLKIENLGRGVKVNFENDRADIDLYIILQYGVSMPAVAATIIDAVKYNVEQFSGVPVNSVNVMVQDVRV